MIVYRFEWPNNVIEMNVDGIEPVTSIVNAQMAT